MLEQGNKVKVTIPSGYDLKYPAFHKKLNGKIGKVISETKDTNNRLVEPIQYSDKTVGGYINVDLTEAKDSFKFIISIHRTWLSKC